MCIETYIRNSYLKSLEELQEITEKKIILNRRKNNKQKNPKPDSWLGVLKKLLFHVLGQCPTIQPRHAALQ